MPPIYHYTDYRQYLSECFATLKTAQRRLSYRSMAIRLGFAAPNFFKLVVDGKRNVGRESIEKIVVGLKLNKSEAEYFAYLVFFGQAKDPVEKNYYFGLIAALRARSRSASLPSEQFDYFNKWYHPVVREIVAGQKSPVDAELLSLRLGGAVSPARIRLSVALLCRLELLVVDESGCYQQHASVLNTENELNSFAVRRYHEQVLGIAGKALHAIPPPEREIASVTAHLSKNGFERIKKRLQEFREELLQIAHDDTDPEEVYHINLQLYPVTRTVPHEDAK